MNIRNKARLWLPFGVFLLFLISVNVFAGESRFTIRYGSMVNGRFAEDHPKWRITAVNKEEVTTRALKDKGGKRCYWKIRGNNGHTALVRSGESFRVRGDCRLTPVWRRIYTIHLWNKNGTKEYIGKKVTFCKGERWKLPEITVSSLYLFDGWSRTKGSAKADFLCEKRYRETGDLNLYAAMHKRNWASVRFFTMSGGSEYTEFNSAVLEGGTLTLPEAGSSTVYSFAGWSTLRDQKQAMYKAGDVLTVSRNMKLYAVFTLKEGPLVQLKTFDGESYKILIPDGKTTLFPSVALGKKRTLMGWSTKKGKTASPDYLEGQVIPAKAATYYMTAASNPVHNTNAYSKLSLRESEKYARVYFVGDSRMSHPGSQFGNKLKKTRFIAEPSTGYDWLSGQKTGYAQLVKAIKTDSKTVRGKKAVVFCHGINDLTAADKYIAFYREKAKELRSLDCHLYVMSVNPFCAAQRQWYKVRHGSSGYVEMRTQALREAFNKKLKKELSGIYTYLDLSSYLVRTGWPTCSNDAEEVADGLHYTLDTNKRIINAASHMIDNAYQ